MADLGLVVVVVDLQPEPHFLQDRVGLVLAGLAGLDGGLILVLAEVHQLAHRRTGVRRHLDQIKIRFPRQTQCVLYADDPDLLAAGADQSDFRYADAVIDAWIANVVLLSALRVCSRTVRGSPRRDAKKPPRDGSSGGFETRARTRRASSQDACGMMAHER